MLEAVFLKVLNMSLTAAVVILAVLIVRVLLRKAPKIFSYILWIAVLFRLVCPVSFSTAFSLLGALQIETLEKGAVEYITSNSAYEEKQKNEIEREDLVNKPAYSLAQTEKQSSVSGLKGMIARAKWIWLTGVLIMLLYSGVSLIKLVNKLKNTVLLREHVYVGYGIQTPFVLGIVRPRIYLPAILGEEEREYIILHEQIHMKRKDHIIKIISFLVLCLHWFNPLVWAAFFCSEKDMEMSCDEAVIRNIGLDVKKKYSTSLLVLATGKTTICGSPLAFGEGDTKSRVKNILSYKKAGFWLLLVAALAVLAAIVILISNPKGVKDSSQKTKTLAEQLLEAKNPYIGDNSADGRLAGVLKIGEEIGIYKNILQTSVTPYSWTFEFQDQWSDVDKEREFNNIMWKNSVLLMALTDNLGQVFWTYTNSAGEQSEQSIALTDINNYLGIDVKKYSGNIEQVEDLQDRIEKEIKESDGHIFDRFQNFVSQNELETGKEQVSNSADTLKDLLQGGTLPVNIRSISKSAKVIDRFLLPDAGMEDYEDITKGELAFADDCVYRVNYNMNSVQYMEVNFDIFADLINQGSESQNRLSDLTFQDGFIVEADLLDGNYIYGIQYSQKIKDDSWYDHVKGAFSEYYTLVNTVEADVSESGGMEIIETYTGNIGDGESGLVLIKDYQGRLLYTEYAHAARAGWNNIYLGQTEGVSFLMTVHIEDRDMYGSYDYQVFRLDKEGEILQIAGSNFAFGNDGIEYYDDLFQKWVDQMDDYLAASHLLLSSQDAEINTEHVTEVGKWSYETLRR